MKDALIKTILVLVVLLMLYLLLNGWPIEPEQHWVAVHTGTVNEPGSYYGFWSGFGSILERVVELLVIGFILLRKHNCHERGCPRMGRFPALEGGGWSYCRKHHRTNGEHTDAGSCTNSCSDEQ